ncbi:MAG: DUF87 domain-containing protein [Deltaproteobacteria bacterium]|nr:DUF87 domain-containing protein [Deltaproteobacteria bacterium]
MRDKALSQRVRLLLVIIEAAMLCGASKVAFGTILPPPEDKGFWFYTALLGLILGTRLDTPFFAKPADVVLYATPAAIALGIASSWSTWGNDVRITFTLAVAFCVVVTLLGAAAIIGIDARAERGRRLANVARVLAETLGAPRVIYSVVIAFALYAFHRSSAVELGVIGAAWALTGMSSLIDSVIRLGQRVWRVLATPRFVDIAGEVIGYQTPGLMLVRQAGSHRLIVGELVAVRDALGESRLALALDQVGRDQGLLVRLLELPIGALPWSPDGIETLPKNTACSVADPPPEIASHAMVIRADTLVGLVAPDTSVERLYFDVVRSDGLEEGRLVEVSIGGRVVTYQLVNGLTKEEIVEHKNTFGYTRAQAQKMGEWDAATQRFAVVKWLPTLNAPVFLRATSAPPSEATAVGHIPGTDYPVFVKSIDELVTHNTAILGILGVGKSTLAIELVERMIAAGIRVICLDLTNQYASELGVYIDSAVEATSWQKIQEAGGTDAQAWSEHPEQGGSMPALREAFRIDLTAFLREDNTHHLKIYNPAQVVGTKQLTEPKSYQSSGKWQRSAALWGVTPVEVTRLVTETALMLVQDRMSSKARVCLVYEEAHSLVPEFTAVASASDREATNGTARAILQGRKYGLGCLVLSQRTANVTKSILNQCNTVFAMRTFDETGKEFLANYIGKEYAGALSSLQERHAVLYGKASSCENPVLICLNDRAQFVAKFRTANPPPPLATREDSAVPKA